MFEAQRQDAELRRLARVKQMQREEPARLGPAMVQFFKQAEKRQTKLGKIAEAWQKLVPALLAEHTALESLNRGTLSVVVDSSAHLYDLKQLLLAGLEKQLLLACKSAGLRKITLRSGRWYAGDAPADRKISF